MIQHLISWLHQLSTMQVFLLLLAVLAVAYIVCLAKIYYDYIWNVASAYISIKRGTFKEQ